ncbi:sensor histidine kinase [Sphingomonas rubra]|uniref:histidine kinase n=1 Tax=Sphingomonas rubra TaxID=634430 RepID=A0A1I5S0X5_9SPHN|nr:HAMP domain-containing sensor histidine kinase [Sphingomonas rubra]SFP64383.1 Signal transduction histidine kinase [Sphingomonas rubra]
MNAVDPNGTVAVAHAVLDADGALLSADPALEALHARAGGVAGGSMAVPQLASIARLARRLGIVVSRRITVADEDADLDLWVRAQPEGDRIRLAASGWSEQPAWRPSAEMPAVPAGDWQWESDASLRLTFLSLDGAGGFDPFTLLGRPLTALFVFDEGAGGGLPILDALARRRPFRDQPATVRLTGAPVVLDAVIRHDAEGGFAGLAGSAREAVTDEGEGDATTPGAFAAGLDRALRAPLGRIVANADSISARADGPIADDYAAYATDIAGAGRHLLGLVDGLVDLQAIERSDFRPLAEPIDLDDVVRRAAGLLAVKAERAGVAIVRVPSDARASAIADFGRTLQIMVNLVGNAVRYAPPGSQVEIAVERAGAAVRVTVSDRGKGIDREDQARVFEKFERVDPSEPGGSGLGLFIARRLARAMRGDLTLRSEAGAGAAFTLSLPAGQPAGE